jgi:hypothetical protein
MSKITKHNLQMQIDTLKGFRVSMQAEINGMKEWISELEKQQTQPNVTLPKSTRYDAEVLSRLDSLEARMDMIEEMLKTEPDPEPEPQKERKIVFDWLVGGDGRKKSPIHKPFDFYEVIEIYKIGDNSFLFGAKDKSWHYPYIYIGHYE